MINGRGSPTVGLNFGSHPLAAAIAIDWAAQYSQPMLDHR